MVSLKTIRVKIDDIEMPDIPLRMMDDEVFKSLVRSISELGYIEPIQVVEKCDGGYKLLNGYHRFQVLKDVFNYSEIDVIVVGKLCCGGESDNCMDEFDYYINAIRLNNIHGDWRISVLREVLKTLIDKAENKGISREDLIRRLGKTDLIDGLLKKQKRREENTLRKNIISACREIAMNHDDGISSYVVFTYGGKLILVYPLMNKEEFMLISSFLEELNNRGKRLLDVLREAINK
ncbi:MAG: ParB/RepB/Spo0J family partition protein [Thermofilaceae archaeon]